MRRPAHARRHAVLTSVALTATVLAGCSSDGDGAGTALPTRSAESTPPVPPASPTTSPTPPAPTPAPDTTSPTPTPVPAGPVAPADVETFATGLEAPWGLAFLPEGGALVSERDTTKIRRVAADGRVSDVGEVPGVVPAGEGGLLGIALSPGFAEDRLLYAYFTTGADNRVVRMEVTDDLRGLGRPEVLLDGIPRAGNHNGGRLAFGPDGMLYVATGDASRSSTAQDRGSLAGKILRMTPAGDVPADNPYEDSLVWSLGHRNVQGLAFDDAGRLWASEFGQKDYDEVNLIEAGANYGWPEVEGPGGGGDFTEPVATWTPTDTASPSGIAWVRDTLFLGALAGERLLSVPVPDGEAGEPTAYAEEQFGRLRTVAAAPDGSLWVITSNTDGRGDVRDGDDRILRVALRPIGS